MEFFKIRDGIELISAVEDVCIVRFYDRSWPLKGPRMGQSVTSLFAKLKNPLAEEKLIEFCSTDRDLQSAIESMWNTGCVARSPNESDLITERPSHPLHHVLTMHTRLPANVGNLISKSESARIVIVDLEDLGMTFATTFRNWGLNIERVYKIGYPESTERKPVPEENWLASVEDLLPAVSNANCIVVVGTYGNETFARINEVFVQSKVRWIPVLVDDCGGAIGPWLGPGGPCYQCLGVHSPTPAGLPMVDVAPIAHHLVFACIGRLTGAFHDVAIDSQVEFDFYNLRSRRVRYWPKPDCTICGTVKFGLSVTSSLTFRKS